MIEIGSAGRCALTHALAPNVRSAAVRRFRPAGDPEWKPHAGGPMVGCLQPCYRIRRPSHAFGSLLPARNLHFFNTAAAMGKREAN